MILSFSLGEQAVVGVYISLEDPVLGSTISSTLLASIHSNISFSLSRFSHFRSSVLENEYNNDQNYLS